MSLKYNSEYYYKFYFWATNEHGNLVTTNGLSLKHGDDIFSKLREYMTSSNVGGYASRACSVTIMKQAKEGGGGVVTSETYQISREFAGPTVRI